MKIILLNGPAGSGKDAAAELLKREIGGHIVKFAAPLKAAAVAICFEGNWKAFNEFDLDQSKKIEPRPEFFGVSCRQFQIDVSEKFMKPTYGVDVFGKTLATKINYLKDLGEEGPYIVSDSGFVPEAEVLVRTFGAENVVLIRLHREGHDYSGDSRDYVNLDHLLVSSYDVYNNGTLEELATNLVNIIQ